MPDLVDLYLQNLERQRAPVGRQAELYPITQQLRRDPASFIKGATVGAGAGALESLGGNILNAIQAFSPVPVFGATEELPEGLGARARSFFNALLLDLPRSFQQRQEEAARIAGAPQTTEEQVTTALSGTGEFLLRDIASVRDIQELVRGERQVGINELGQPITEALTPEESGKLFTQAILKTIPFAKLVAAPVQRALQPKGTFVTKAQRQGLTEAEIASVRPETARLSKITKTPTIGEIEAQTIATRDLSAVAPEPPIGRVVEPPLESTPARRVGETARQEVSTEFEGHFQLKNTLSDPEIGRIVDEVVRSSVWEQVKATKGQPTDKIARAIREGALSEGTVARLSQTYDVPLAQTTNAIASALRASETEFGKGMQRMSAVAEQLHAELVVKANRGDKAAIRELQELNRLRESVEGDGPLQIYAKFAQGYIKPIEGLRRAAATGQTVTTARNLLVQQGILALQAFEGAVAGTIEGYIGKKILKDGRSFGEYYADFIGAANSLLYQFTPQRRAVAKKILDSFPFTKQRIESAYAADVETISFTEMLKGQRPKSFREAVRPVQSILSVANRAQEIHMRRMFFLARLEGNLRSIGFKGSRVLHDLVDEARKPVLDEHVRLAVADAETHAFKQTLSFRPEGGFLGKVLDMYNTFPFLTAFGPMFPRFMINSFMWQLERAPTMWFNMFSKEFRDQLFAGANQGFASRQAARTLGEATMGGLMLNAAWVIRNSAIGGPKYYQVKSTANPLTGHLADEQEYDDMRPWSPFDKMLFLADVMKSAQLGAEINLTPNEWIDALTGVRRLSEVPVFALTDILRSTRSSDPQTVNAAIKTPIGQWFSAFFVPMHTIREIYGGTIGDIGNLTARDVSGQELTGPTRAAFPGPTDLPPRVDPFTGKERIAEHPLMRQILGTTRTRTTALQRLVLNTPDITVSDLVGEHYDPRANQLVARNIGTVLSTPIEGKDTLGDMIAEALGSQPLTPLERKERLREVFTAIREEARTAAESESPNLFIEYNIKSKLPPSQQPGLLRVVSNILQTAGAR